MIKEILSAREPRVFSDRRDSTIHAGVLIPILKQESEYRILFTKRTQKVEHHKGQISFPGGKFEEQDRSLEDTALREAQEEIGLKRENVQLLGRLDDAKTVSTNFIVRPFVGYIPFPYPFILSRAEVESLISVPFEVFHPKNLKTRGATHRHGGKIYPTVTFQYQGEVIWGATARIMENFMEIIGERIDLPDPMR